MTEFTLDTSGAVSASTFDPPLSWAKQWTWPDLSPFAQGYVEAALRGYATRLQAGASTLTEFEMDSEAPSFRHLAPATLAAMLKDCEAFQKTHGSGTPKPPQDDTALRALGASTWRARQHQASYSFPPLTLYLADDGLIYARGASQ